MAFPDGKCVLWLAGDALCAYVISMIFRRKGQEGPRKETRFEPRVVISLDLDHNH